MPEHRTDAAATPAPDDTLRERLAERASLLAVSKSEQAKIVDVLLPTVREHVAAAVQAERERTPTKWAYDQACKALHKHRERAEVAEAEEHRVKNVLRDIADHGLRADLNPTVPSLEHAESYGWWMNYLRRIDASVRQRARAALDGEATP